MAMGLGLGRIWSEYIQWRLCFDLAADRAARVNSLCSQLIAHDANISLPY